MSMFKKENAFAGGGSSDDIMRQRAEQTYHQARDAFALAASSVAVDVDKMIAKAKAEVASMSVQQYRLECLRMSGGDIQKAAEMFAFVMGGDK
jgi:hypothetical protein